MTSIPWAELPRALAAAATAIVADGQLPQARSRTWPSDEDCGKALWWLLPRAIQATETAMRGHDPTRLTAPYRAQEKLNGVWALWDGAQLRTKTGNVIDAPPAFLDALPPAFPLIGELFMGYGHDQAQHVRSVATNRQPAGVPDPWRFVRLVAFDVPGIGSQPYHVRYRLLCQVVGSWYRRRQLREPALALLQVIRQYPVQDVATMFREVVHGQPYQRCTHPPFGVPAVRPTLSACPELGGELERAYVLQAGVFLAEGVCPFDTDSVGAAGEGLMLWDQEGVWKPRGRHGSRSRAVVKFKPTVLTTGRVTHEPYLPSRTQKDDDPLLDEDELCGYHVRLKWWNRIGGTWNELVAYAPPSLDARHVAETFAAGSRVFFTFVLFDRHPWYMHALGPRLTLERAQQVALQEAHDRRPPLERLADAALWQHGEMRALFPAEFRWDPEMVVRQSYHNLRIRAHPSLLAGGGRGEDGARAVRADVKAEEEALRNHRNAMWSHFTTGQSRWLTQTTGFLPRFLVASALLTVAWGRPIDWSWTRDDGPVPPLTEWGPFQIAPLPSKGHVATWIHGLMRALLTVVAAAWQRLCRRLSPSTFVDVIGATAVQRWLDDREAEVRVFLEEEVWTAWDAPSVRDKLCPPAFGQDLWPVDDSTRTVSATHVGRYVQHQLGTNPWALLLLPWGLATRAQVPIQVPWDAVACHDAWLAGSEGDNYRTLLQGHLLRGYLLDTDGIRVDPNTFLPRAVVAPLPVLLPHAAGSDGDLAADSQRAAMAALRRLGYA